MQNFFEYFRDSILLYIKVTPNAKENKILGIMKDGFLSYLKIAINAVPEKGKANKELINFLAKELAISKTTISLEKGSTSQKKLVRIYKLDSNILTKLNDIRDY